MDLSEAELKLVKGELVKKFRNSPDIQGSAKSVIITGDGDSSVTDSRTNQKKPVSWLICAIISTDMEVRNGFQNLVKEYAKLKGINLSY